MTTPETRPESRPNASRMTIRTCPVCRTTFAPRRRWQTYCCTACRKKAWIFSKQVDASADVRSTLQEILQRLDGIEKSLASFRDRGGRP